MFVGHVGAGLAIARAEPRVNAGVFVGAALLLDVVLWVLVLLGIEHATIPRDFAQRHIATFEFPYSHGLVAALVWSALAGAIVVAPRSALRPYAARVGLLVGAAVSSHWVLDVLVHVPELPLVGPASPQLGLALWESPPQAIALEVAIAVIGLWLYLGGAALPRAKKVALAVLVLLLTVFTIAGMTVAPPPPSAAAMAGSSLATLLVVCGLFVWLDMARSRAHGS
jgi:hypothetical protein